MRLLVLKRVVLATGAAAIAAVFAASSGGSWAGLLDLVPLLFLAWCLLPLALLWTFGRADDPRAAAILLLALAAVAVAGGTYLYVDAMVVHPDPQSPIVLAVVPAFQLALVLPGLAVAWLVRRRSRQPAG